MENEKCLKSPTSQATSCMFFAETTSGKGKCSNVSDFDAPSRIDDNDFKLSSLGYNDNQIM